MTEEPNQIKPQSRKPGTGCLPILEGEMGAVGGTYPQHAISPPLFPIETSLEANWKNHDADRRPPYQNRTPRPWTSHGTQETQKNSPNTGKSTNNLHPYYPDQRAKSNTRKTEILTLNSLSNAPLFYTIKAADENLLLSNMCPIKIWHDLTKKIGKPKKLHIEKDGSLMLEVYNQEQGNKLKKLTQLLNLNIAPTLHPTLNQSKGVISAPFFLKSDEETLLEELAGQGVIEVKRITRFLNGTIINTPSLILTFETSNLPLCINLLYLTFPVNPYIPNPRRCRHCQRLGHTKKWCRTLMANQTGNCPTCSSTCHALPCLNSPLCINCSGPHPPSDPKCPRYLAEKEILALHITERITLKEARSRVRQQTPNMGETYASAAGATSITKTNPFQPSTQPLAPHPGKILKPTSINLQLIPRTSIPENMITPSAQPSQTNPAFASPPSPTLSLSPFPNHDHPSANAPSPAPLMAKKDGNPSSREEPKPQDRSPPCGSPNGTKTQPSPCSPKSANRKKEKRKEDDYFPSPLNSETAKKTQPLSDLRLLPHRGEKPPLPKPQRNELKPIQESNKPTTRKNSKPPERK